MNQKYLICTMMVAMDVFFSFATDQDLVRTIVPYQCVRSLQRALDEAMRGDISLQKKIPDIVKETGVQLRATHMDVFVDNRNIDAVWIYTIISQDLSVVDDLIAKDTKGYFDIAIVYALKKYFSGQLEESSKELSKIKDKDNTRGIVPYLHLLIGRAMMPFSSQQAVHFFDYVRLTSPGTFLEEIALRNLLEITQNEVGERAFGYIRAYVTQFHHSIYKDHFISVLLRFFLHGQLKLPDDDIVFTISFFSLEEQRAIYLKIAQNSVISGKRKIGFLAIKQLKRIIDRLDYKDLATIQLYENILNIPFVDIMSLQRSTCNIPYYSLMEQDRYLKKASEIIMSEIGKSLIDIDFEHIQKDLLLDKKEPRHTNVSMGIESFIKKNRSQIESIDVLLAEAR
ncbi:MAG: chemotaxis protein [Candidatus Liberibacter asiaticus]|uniref:chemotaxis protein n=1 Tax=Liberibacter asiaticus TaxID=34021 RepID=UPI0004E079AE|nr:chemotaxis protein [Candidatus Liberibacter asiaticus]MDI1493781.1 chemotaxis protein [Candidatus Liberibacter asiaticus]QYK83681.1 chemotaxis protein [Candidatus Liberibacter asiaticus]WCM58073.1 chemotaxis protein [Candidatus Liberibacter asiaticus]BAP26553.1 chemotaxis protein [Candidatus Liberibacter asiaticus str. Ishi-1]